LNDAAAKEIPNSRKRRIEKYFFAYSLLPVPIVIGSVRSGFILFNNFYFINTWVHPTITRMDQRSPPSATKK
jgi:hypothetical protein